MSRTNHKLRKWRVENYTVRSNRGLEPYCDHCRNKRGEWRKVEHINRMREEMHELCVGIRGETLNPELPLRTP